MDDLDNYLKVAVDLSSKAADIVREKIWSLKSNIQTKQHAADLVTETDKYVEKFLMNGILEHFPNHKFIAEESTSEGGASFTADPTWIIDPVDGTLNFVHGYPNVCISIGLTIDKELAVAVIQIPVHKMVFTAVKGRGAFLNDKPIHVSNVTDLSAALVSVEPVLRVTGNAEQIKMSSDYYLRLLENAQGLRTSGSAAFNLCMVAMGASDAYTEIGIHAWDIAGGALIVQEAGGVTMDPDGKPLDLMSRRILATSTASLADQLIPLRMVYHPTRDDANYV